MLPFYQLKKRLNVSAYVEQKTLIFDWVIEKNYYLYRDRFKIESPSSLIQFSQIEFETGITKWDDFFETDMEVYYLQTRLAKYPLKTIQITFQFKLESQGCADAGFAIPHTLAGLNQTFYRFSIQYFTTFKPIQFRSFRAGYQ